LYNLGPAIERIYGKVRYLMIYLAAGIAGNLTTWYLESRSGDYAISAGASGAIFGLFGAYVALALIPSMRRYLSLRGIVVTLVLNIAYGMTYAGVNMAAHLGGLIGGAAVAAVMILNLKLRTRRGKDHGA
ncbi:MAG: rhomboid family intramembrane serine protease, partial [Lachnospiraceae bacterium]|nr:rhomboid family intramembrane serine protease [Lachnospiraceae bacterium]